MRTKAGLSLVELMVAVAVIGILVALALPRYHAFLAQARRGEAKSNLAHLASLQAVYKIEHFRYYSGSALLAPDGGIGYKNEDGTRGDCGDYADDRDQGLNNHLGFRPQACGQLRYFYQLRPGNVAVAFAYADDEGRYIYPDCHGGGREECDYTRGDAVRMALRDAKPTVCRNITKYCPAGLGAPPPPPPPPPTPTPDPTPTPTPTPTPPGRCDCVSSEGGWIAAEKPADVCACKNYTETKTTTITCTPIGTLPPGTTCPEETETIIIRTKEGLKPIAECTTTECPCREGDTRTECICVCKVMSAEITWNPLSEDYTCKEVTQTGNATADWEPHPNNPAGCQDGFSCPDEHTEFSRVVCGEKPVNCAANCRDWGEWSACARNASVTDSSDPMYCYEMRSRTCSDPCAGVSSDGPCPVGVGFVRKNCPTSEAVACTGCVDTTDPPPPPPEGCTENTNGNYCCDASDDMNSHADGGCGDDSRKVYWNSASGECECSEEPSDAAATLPEKTPTPQCSCRPEIGAWSPTVTVSRYTCQCKEQTAVTTNKCTPTSCPDHNKPMGMATRRVFGKTTPPHPQNCPTHVADPDNWGNCIDLNGDGNCKQQQVVTVLCNNPCEEGKADVCIPIRTDQVSRIFERGCPEGVPNPCQTEPENTCSGASPFMANARLPKASEECGKQGGLFQAPATNVDNIYDCKCESACASYTHSDHDGHTVQQFENILFTSAQYYCNPDGGTENDFTSEPVPSKSKSFTCSCTSPPPPPPPPTPQTYEFYKGCIVNAYSAARMHGKSGGGDGTSNCTGNQQCPRADMIIGAKDGIRCLGSNLGATLTEGDKCACFDRIGNNLLNTAADDESVRTFVTDIKTELDQVYMSPECLEDSQKVACASNDNCCNIAPLLYFGQ